MFRSFRRCVVVILAAMSLVGVTFVTARVADAAVTVDGEVRTLAADTVDRSRNPKVFKGHSEDIYQQVLTVGTKSYFLKGKKARPNSKVRVTGTVAGNNFTATTVATTGTLAGVPASGSTRVLTMLAYWTAPDTVTPARAAQQLHTDSNGWYRDASYGALGQVGDVTPWLRIAGPTTGCYADHLDLMAQAKTAAAALGYNTANYDNFVLYFPNCGGDATGFAGWAYVGSTGTWLNGYMDRRVTVHEAGHNYGLWHSHSRMCSGGGLTGTCTFTDYGDDYDAMGSSDYVGHFNASQKSILGWIGSRVVNLSAGGSTTLVPMAADQVAPHAAYVAYSSGRRYWLEYRQPVDYDAGLPLSGTDGVLVHVSGDGSGGTDTGASLIDVRPGDGISETTSTLKAGQSWLSPEGTRITVGTITPTGAQVTVSSSASIPTVTAKSPAAGATGVATAAGTAMTATFSEGVTGVSGTSFTLKQGTTAVAATVAYNATTRVATLTPTAALVADKAYTLALTSTIKSASGGALAAQSWSFITGPRPVVTTTTPASGATGVSLGTSTARTPMKATFSEAVTGVSGTSFTLKQGTTAVAAAVTYDAATRVATLTPTAALVADKTYTLALTATIKDPAGNPITAKTWTFITGPRPVVTTKTPASGATSVSRTANITATLSEPVTGIPTTAAASGNFTIKQTSTGTALASVASYNTTSRVATLNPTATLLASTNYTVTLTSGVKDVAGNTLTTLVWSFTTGTV